MHIVHVPVSNIRQIIVPTGTQILVRQVTQVGKLKMVQKHVSNKVPVALRLRLHRKKVMEVLVLPTVTVPRVRVVVPTVVVLKEDPVDAMIVIQMVIVHGVAPIITEPVISVMPAVAVKQVHLSRRLLHLVLLLPPLLLLLPIQKLKVIHVVLYLEDLILRIKQHVRVPHVVLV